MYKTINRFKYLNYIIFFSFICLCFNYNIFGIDTITINGQAYYEINNEDDLFEFAKIVNGCSKYTYPYPKLNANAILMNDIHVKRSERWNPIAYDFILNNYLSKIKIGFTGKPFKDPLLRGYEGTFDGNGHTISNLCCVSPYSNNVGFFGKIGEYGVVKNLTILNSYFAGQDDANSAGLICAVNNGSILNCYAIITMVDQNRIRQCSTAGYPSFIAGYPFRENNGIYLIRIITPKIDETHSNINFN